MYPCCVLCSGQNGDKSAGFSVFDDCSVDLRRDGFVFLSDADFVQKQDCSTSEIVCSLHEINQMCIGYSRALQLFEIHCLEEAFIIDGIYFCSGFEAQKGGEHMKKRLGLVFCKIYRCMLYYYNFALTCAINSFQPSLL